MEWILFAGLAVVAGSLHEITQKKALNAAHTLEYLVARGLMVSLMTLSFIPFLQLPETALQWLMCLGAGLFFAIGTYFYNRANKHQDISLTQPLVNFSPVFVALLAFILLGESLTLLQIGGIALLVFGTYVLELKHDKHDVLEPLKELWASPHARSLFLGMLIIAFGTIIARHAVSNFTNSYTYFILSWGSAGIWLAGAHAMKYRLHGVPRLLQSNLLGVFLPSFFLILLCVFYYEALSMAYAGLVAAVIRIQSLITTLEGGYLLHEDHLVKKGVACTIMVFGAALMVF